MRIDPAQQILAFWGSVARYSFHNGLFVSSGDENDALADAEQLLCILLPATELPAFRLDQLDQTRPEMLDALRLIGDDLAVRLQLLQAMADHFDRYTDADGTPTFGAARYLPSDLRRFDIVESYAVGLRLGLAAIGYCKVLRRFLTRSEMRDLTSRIEAAASHRVTAAMVGLLRSFTVHTFAYDGDAGSNLLAMVRQEHRPDDTVAEELDRRLAEVRAGLRDLTVGLRQLGDVELPGAFQCGWAWGVVADAPTVETPSSPPQPGGIAAAVPVLYFTAAALDAIPHLTSMRTRLLGLLDDDQLRLASALRLRWDITLAYWSRLATFGDHEWPLDRLPWRTPTGHGSDHESLQVAAVTSRDLSQRHGSQDIDLSRVVRVLGQLATRQGITRPPSLPDSRAFDPGPIAVDLADQNGSAIGVYRGPTLRTRLFTTVLRAAAATENPQLRADLNGLAELTWDRLVAPSAASVDVRDLGENGTPNWHDVLGVIEGLCVATDLPDLVHGGADLTLGFAHQLLADADAMFDALAGREHVGSPEAYRRIRSRLDRARTLLDSRRAHATALLYQCVAELDDLLEARTTGPAGE